MRRVIAVAACIALPAMAARPLNTEDASILEEKACQLETWLDRTRDATQGWLVPACNFGAHVEWQAGFARTHAQGASAFSEAYVQAKTAWHPRDDGAWSVGAVAGVVRRPLRAAARGWRDAFATFPVSGDLGPVLVHVNAGWSRDAEARRDVTTWAIAIEQAPLARTVLLAEAFGQNREKPYLRAGLRHTAIPNRLDIDVSVVTRAGGERSERFVSVGLLVQTGRFLP